jgi:hypothetical protein
MKRLVMCALGLSLFSSAQAYTITIAPEPNDLLAFQDDCNGSCVGRNDNVNVTGLGTFTGNVTVYGAGISIPNVATPPTATNAYLSVGGGPGGAATLITDGYYNALYLEWGSIDGTPIENVLTIDPKHGAPIIITGDEILSLIPGSISGVTSAFVEITDLPKYDKVQFSSNLNAFEMQFEGTPCPVPEMSTWLMMLVGFAGLSYTAYNRRRVAISIV